MRIGSLRMVLTKVMVALVFLLGPGAAQAVAIVQFDDSSDPTKATGILNLDVPGFGMPFNVAFDQQAFASEIYGPSQASPDDPDPLPPFFTAMFASEAADAANAALNAAGALTIGEVGSQQGSPSHNIGWIAFILDPPILDPVDGIAVIRSAVGGADWGNLGENFLLYNGDERAWAVFTVVPEPGTALMLGLGLAGLGVVGRSRREESKATA